MARPMYRDDVPMVVLVQVSMVKAWVMLQGGLVNEFSDALSFEY